MNFLHQDQEIKKLNMIIVIQVLQDHALELIADGKFKLIIINRYHRDLMHKTLPVIS